MKQVGEMNAEELEYVCESPLPEHGGFSEDYVEAAKTERSARLRERDAAKKWGERYPASVGGGDGNRLLDEMLAARSKEAHE